MKTPSTREEWLIEAIDKLRPLFDEAGHELPEVRVSVGWPSRGATSKKRVTIGQYWDKKAASDDVGQIFISPLLDKSADEMGVLATLLHELVHAVFGVKEGHGKNFGKVARLVGLEGKLTSTHAGEALRERLEKIAGELGAFPHARLNPSANGIKKQTTRLLKCTCPECGYNVRMTQKWIDEAGTPICPSDKISLVVEVKDENPED